MTLATLKTLVNYLELIKTSSFDFSLSHFCRTAFLDYTKNTRKNWTSISMVDVVAIIDC